MLEDSGNLVLHIQQEISYKHGAEELKLLRPQAQARASATGASRRGRTRSSPCQKDGGRRAGGCAIIGHDVQHE